MTVRTLPGFLVMGVPKAGTTSLHRYLARHPQVFLPYRKEIHHFTSEAMRRNVAGPGDAVAAGGTCASLDEYERLFEPAGPHRLAGDVSPSYFYFTECYEPIRRTLGGEVKVIVLFRNPVDRAFSHYLHLRRHGLEPLTFRDALDQEEARARRGYGDFWRYKDHSRYSARFADLLATFPAGNVLAIPFDDLAADPAGVVARVARFLGIDETAVDASVGRAHNPGTRTRNGSVARWLVAPSRAKAVVARRLPLSVTDRYRAARDALLAHGGEPLPTLDRASRDHLVDAVGVEVELMRSAHGIDLSTSTYAPSASPVRSTS